MNTSSKLSKFPHWLLSNKWMRVFWLSLAGLAGLALFKCAGGPILDYLDIAKVGDGKSSYPANARGYLVLPILSLFVIFALWVFRTYDTRQQIEQTNRQLQQANQQANRQLQQANFAKGLDNLVSNNPLQVDVGVILLLEVSRETSVFDKEIRLAFIKRLKEMPKEFEGQKVEEGLSGRLSYAQYIIQWLIDNPKISGKKPDFRGMNCAYHEFTSDRFSGGTNPELEMVKILPEVSGEAPRAPHISSGGNSIPPPVFDFRWADCKNINFKNIDLCAFDFRGAKRVNMVDGYMMNRSRYPRGIDTKTLSEYIEYETGKVIENPPVGIE